MSAVQVWRSGMPALETPDGLVLAYSSQGFWQNLADEQILYSRQQLKQSLAGQIKSEHGVGYWQGQPVFMLELEPEALDEQHFKPVNARHYMLQGELATCRMLGFAAQVATWADTHRFCGRCAAPMHSDQLHRRRYCAACGLENYPRISPCMIVLVSRGDELLLARAPRFVAGMYSVLAGFAEPGESIEDCVRREVMEETSIKVKNLSYITSQNWPFPHSMMLGFHAEYASGEIVPQLDELEDAAWFNIHDLPQLPMPGSIARYLIDLHLFQRLGGSEPVLPY